MPLLLSISEDVLGSRQVTDVSERACKKDVPAKFLRIAFGNKNPAIAQKWSRCRVLHDFARCSIIHSSIVDGMERIQAGRKMQSRDGRFRPEFEIMRKDEIVPPSRMTRKWQ